MSTVGNVQNTPIVGNVTPGAVSNNPSKGSAFQATLTSELNALKQLEQNLSQLQQSISTDMSQASLNNLGPSLSAGSTLNPGSALTGGLPSYDTSGMAFTNALDGAMMQNVLNTLLNSPLKQSVSVAGAQAGSTSQSLSNTGAQTTTIPSTPQNIMSTIQQASQQYGVPANLIRGVIQQESGMNQYAVSSTGAIGLMQLEPTTAKELGVTNAFDATQNIMGGTKYLASLLQKFNGNQALALAAYNAGSGAVEQYGGIPPYPQTINYVQKVTQYANEFQTQMG